MAWGTIFRIRVCSILLVASGMGRAATAMAFEFSATPVTEPRATATAAIDDDDAAEVKLEYKPIVGISLFAGALASVALPLEHYKTPPACRWCGGAHPNVVDRWARNARWERPCRAGKLSYWSLGVASAVALGPMSHESSNREWLANAGAVLDSVAVTVMVTQAAKYAFRRERPSPNPCLVASEVQSDRNLSFFSGHTALAFAVAASARETSRLHGRTRSDWLWVSGASAALTGYFRIAGDRHHLTDVLVGAGVGTFIGTWVPRHLHRPKTQTVTTLGITPQIPQVAAPQVIGITRSLESGGKRFLFQVGKGPGKSVQFGLSF